MKLRILILAALALPLAAQQRFAASTGVVVLNNAAQAVTIQQPATGGSTPLFLESAIVTCTVTCTPTQTQNATAATATAGTAVAISGGGGFAATAKVFTASNFSGGTTVPPVLPMTGGGTTVIDLSKVVIPPGGSAANYTVSIAAITGSANITIVWKELAQ